MWEINCMGKGSAEFASGPPFWPLGKLASFCTTRPSDLVLIQARRRKWLMEAIDIQQQGFELGLPESREVGSLIIAKTESFFENVKQTLTDLVVHSGDCFRPSHGYFRVWFFPSRK